MMPATNASVGPPSQMSYGMFAGYQPQVSLLCFSFLWRTLVIEPAVIGQPEMA